MERIVNTMEENPKRRNIMKVLKDYNIEYVIEKGVKSIKPKRINSCWSKVCPFVMHNFTEFTIEPIKKTRKEMLDMANKVGGWVKSFKIQILEKFKS